MSGSIKEGSYTVEASFIFPIIILLIMGTLIFAFYLHDRTVLTEMGMYYTKELFHMLDEPVDVNGRPEIERLEEQNLIRLGGYKKSIRPEVVAAQFKKSAESRLLISKVTKAEANASETGVSFSYEAECGGPLFMRLIGFAGMPDGYSGSSEMNRPMSPEEFVRIIRGVIWRKDQT